MTTAADTPAAVPLAQRLGLLADVPMFASLPPAALAEMAARLREERYPADAAIVSEGEASEFLSLIVSGAAEVTADGPSGPAPLATLGPGELFGEAGLLNPAGVRTATVRARTSVIVLSMDDVSFANLLAAYPTAHAALAATAESRAIANFLKQASPFAALAPARRTWLAARLTPHAVAAGDIILRQGETGSECYLLRRGRVEVLLEGEAGAGRRLATLGPGALIGETALLTAAPRSATVRALEACDLLVLARADLLTALGSDPQAVGARLLELLQLRARPRQVPGVRTYPRLTPEGETVTILKDPARGAYFRLSPLGWFVWQRLDGAHTLRDVTLDDFTAHKRFAPAAIAEVIGGLAQAGFVVAPGLVPEAQTALIQLPWWQLALVRARQVMEWRAAIPHADAPLARLYRAGIWLVYTRAAQLGFGALAILGLAAFLATSREIAGTMRATHAGGHLLLFLIPAYLLSILIHEAGHAFTVKAFGREVPRVGVGWYWFSPVAYVDTSDMWLAEKWPRVAVSLAGPYSNIILAGAAALVGWFVGRPTIVAALWLFALTSYLGVLFNLIPLLELDGYYVLMDLLDRPNLRARALAWLGRECFPAVRRDGWSGLRGHGVDLAYALLSLLFVAIMAAVTIALYRLSAQRWLEAIIPHGAAAGLAWVLAAVVVALALATTIGDLRGGHAARAG